ncbi:Mov34/MPN/PAD-1 family protein [Xanthomonas hydrangeae]|uniref:Mov34/MPN/PAD-1 family protein n=1 Tax=Xanthomonas hydrangeae TaxID=2775159 RepID=UPI0019661E0A
MEIYQLQSRRFYAFLEESACAKMRKLRQLESDDSEAGGILIGETRPESLAVTEVTTPQTNDRRGRFFFNRQSDGHQQPVQIRWQESGGELDYIGEWHTHPEVHPSPSFIDKAGWILRSLKAGRPLLVVIVGQEKNYVALQDGLRLEEMLPCK